MHVLPHPGGGGETYVDLLDGIRSVRGRRLFLTSTPGGEAASFARLPAAAVRANVRCASADLVHAHGEVTSLLLLPALALRPSVVTLHGLNLVRRASGRRRDLAVAALRAVTSAATCVICVADSELDEARHYVGARLAGRLTLVRNGVDPSPPPNAARREATRRALGVQDDTVLFIHVGSLAPPKDPLAPADAILALAREGLPVRLAIVGDGPLRGELERRSAQGGGALALLGHRDDIGHLLEASDVFTLSSSREGLPFALLEAMARGMPAVVSDVPGCREAIGSAGIVARTGDSASFAAAFRQLALDQALRGELALRARSRCAAEFSAGNMRDSTLAIYEWARRTRRGHPAT
jgi:glycosyltransferase involved in cell wall biosynthesis